MANRIQELIIMLEEEIEQSPRQRLAGGNKRLVDCDKMLDLLGDLKVVVPEEVRLAQTILMEQKAMLRDADSQATEILAKARLESERLIARETVLSEARNRGEAIVREAEEKADAMMQESRDYSQTVMEEVQRYLTRYIEMIDETREDIRRNYRGAPKRFYTRSGGEERIMAQETSRESAPAEDRTLYEKEPDADFYEESDAELYEELEEESGESPAGTRTEQVRQNEQTQAEIRAMPDFSKRQTALLDEDLLRRLE